MARCNPVGAGLVSRPEIADLDLGDEVQPGLELVLRQRHGVGAVSLAAPGPLHQVERVSTLDAQQQGKLSLGVPLVLCAKSACAGLVS